MLDLIIPSAGLLVSLIMLLYLYSTLKKIVFSFEGLLKDEGLAVIGSVMAIGAVEISFFLWMIMEAYKGVETSDLIANILFVIFLALFVYTSGKLVKHLKELEREYEVEMEE